MNDTAVFNGTLGTIAICFALATAAISMVAYGLMWKNGEERFGKIGRVGFHASVLGFMFASATLMFLIFTHQFQYTYVWQHSSSFLSRPLLMASFYAGQEGSFMLWTLLTCIVAVFVMGYAQRVNYEAPVMTIYTLVLVCLLMILVVQSPFETLQASFPGEVPAGYIPPTGKGMNPQLENLWITLHPPILFMGFAAVSVPFVFAIAGLFRKDFQRWITVSLPWTLFASMVLGFGIMLGGWWAYETLGWGGFWAWDPVENSSLIPWLVCVALVHTMLVQKRTGTMNGPNGLPMAGGLVRTNFVLAIFAYVLILYSTFLTRSGVLGDTSVHSFVAPGMFVYAVLLGIIFLFLGIGVVALAIRWRQLTNIAGEMKLMSRENGLALGSAVLVGCSIVTLIGTSWPIIRPIFGLAKKPFETGDFNMLMLPFGFIIVFLNALTMGLKWKNTSKESFIKALSLSTIIAAVGTLGLILLGIHDPIYIALGFGAVLALTINLEMGWKILRGNKSFVGAYVSHAGVALMMLGIVFTARYSVTQHVRLPQGETKEAFGYKMTYKGQEQIELDKTDREKFAHKIEMVKDGSSYEVQPIIFWSDFNKRQSAFLEPGILYYPTKDIYVSPKAIEDDGGNPTVAMHKGDKIPLPFDSSITLRFVKFEMANAAQDGKQSAVVEVATKDSTFPLTASRILEGGRYLPVLIPSTDISIGFGDLRADRENLANSEAVFVFSSPSHPAPPSKRVITVDVSVKPFISFVWAGVIIMVGGFFFSIIRRWKDVFRVVNPSAPSPLQQAQTQFANGEKLSNARPKEINAGEV